MVVNPNGGRPFSVEAFRPNVFALVIYVPEPLAGFLDDLRRELVPDYKPHAHVSVLPPRPLSVDWRRASEEARPLAETCRPFEVELTAVQVFPRTDVIYIEIGAGASDLRAMHEVMNAASLAFVEPFAYHPHITLAQEIPSDQVRNLQDMAARRWREFRGRRSFLAERAMLVQNPVDDVWVDLAEYSLGAVKVG